ncbi:hypothetical protein ACFLU6_02555 [Acidobacteriota bacterium]
MSIKMPYERIPEYPETVGAAAVMARMIDGLAFRFRWATEGLGDDRIDIRPSPDSNSIKEIACHIWGLLNWITISLAKKETDGSGLNSVWRIPGSLVHEQRSIIPSHRRGGSGCSLPSGPALALDSSFIRSGSDSGGCSK